MTDSSPLVLQCMCGQHFDCRCDYFRVQFVRVRISYMQHTGKHMEKQQSHLSYRVISSFEYGLCIIAIRVLLELAA